MNKLFALTLIAAASLTGVAHAADAPANTPDQRQVQVGFCDKAEAGQVLLKADSDEGFALLTAELRKLGEPICAARGEQPGSVVVQGKDGRLAELPKGASIAIATN